MYKTKVDEIIETGDKRGGRKKCIDDMWLTYEIQVTISHPRRTVPAVFKYGAYWGRRMYFKQGNFALKSVRMISSCAKNRRYNGF